MDRFTDEPDERHQTFPTHTRGKNEKEKQDLNMKSENTLKRMEKRSRTTISKTVNSVHQNGAKNGDKCRREEEKTRLKIELTAMAIVCMYVLNARKRKQKWRETIEFLGLPPVTRHVNTMSSPSSIGPSTVPFNWWPHRFNTNGYSGGTKRFIRATAAAAAAMIREQEKWKIMKKEKKKRKDINFHGVQ